MGIILNISTTIAVLSILAFWQALRTHTKQHRSLAKLVAFKSIVFLTFVQTIVYMILGSFTNVLKPTDMMTYADLNIGIPNMIVCFEMVLFSVFFHWAYSYHPYVITDSNRGAQKIIDEEGNAQFTAPLSYQGGFGGWRALLIFESPMEVNRGILFAFKMGAERAKQKANRSSNSMEPLRSHRRNSSSTAYTPYYGEQQQQGQQQQFQQPLQAPYPQQEQQQDQYLQTGPYATPQTSVSRSPSPNGRAPMPSAYTPLGQDRY